MELPSRCLPYWDGQPLLLSEWVGLRSLARSYHRETWPLKMVARPVSTLLERFFRPQ